MTPRTLARMAAAFVALALVLFFAVRSHYALTPIADGAVVESWWRGGKIVARRVKHAGEPVTGYRTNETIVEERVASEAPIAKSLLAFSLVPGLDGVRGELDGKTAYVTVDDLLWSQAYDHATSFMDSSLGIGVPPSYVYAALAIVLGTTPEIVEKRATLTRVRYVRSTPKPRIGPNDVTPALVREAVAEAAGYLARNVTTEGRFRYLVVAPTNEEIKDYSWPRHAGATYFLAQAAALTGDASIRAAALRAAKTMRDDVMVLCGENRCIATTDEADVGSSALGLLAFSEIVRTKADPSYEKPMRELAAFLRAQQRPDGELMHVYDRIARRPRDVQLLYYTGEAALALARAHTVTGDPADLEASKRALARLVGHGWSFFGSRYYYSEEHWTCQAMADLWERAPSPEAFAFCQRWHEYQRALQHDGTDSPFDADGAFGFGPVLTPRCTPAASRGEAAGATLEVAKKLGSADAPLLEDELRRAIAFVLREQFRPGPTHLFADPEAVRGAVPGSPVDWQLRIDYAQHAGSMMIRWLSSTQP
ncbi:MAG TPA: hypothetical protein VIF62_09305 [Labilithrix sp.]|jgi:hypothetical protein